MKWWLTANQRLIEQAAATKRARVVFYGDSLVQRWAHEGKGVWARRYAPLGALNLGLSGDMTEHLLWRLEQKTLRALCPQVSVVQIGTNNLYRDQPDRIVAAVRVVAERLRDRCARNKVVVLGLFPRGPAPGTRLRTKIRDVNKGLVRVLAGQKRIVFVDLGRRLTDGQGRISKEIMWDFLHLTEEGYLRWAKFMAPTLERLLAR